MDNPKPAYQFELCDYDNPTLLLLSRGVVVRDHCIVGSDSWGAGS